MKKRKFNHEGHELTRTERRIDADKIRAHTRRMAKKAVSAIGGASSTSPKLEKPAEKSGTRITRPSETRQKPSVP